MSWISKASGKDWAIVVLALAVLGLGGVVLADQAAEKGWFESTPEGEPVAVFDVVLDRRELSYLDVLFDSPLGEGREGEILTEPPATLSPAVGGVWRWRDSAALRFEPTDSFAMATEYTLALIPDRLLREGEVFSGPTELRVTTDQFRVETVETFEEAAPGSPPGTVLFRGEIRFNYPVDPRELAGALTLTDPAAGSAGGGEVETFLETTWPSSQVGFRTAPVAKRPAERELALKVAADLTPAEGNVALGGEHTHGIPVGSSERLAVRSISGEPGETESTLALVLSSPITAEAAQRSIQVEPKVDFRADTGAGAGGYRVALTGPFTPGTSYEVRVAEGLAATDGASLKESWKQKVQLASLPPTVGFDGEGTFLSRRGARALALVTVNVSQVDLSIDRVYYNNLFALFQYQSYQLQTSGYRGSTLPRSLGDRIAEKRLTVKAPPNRRTVTPLRLDSYLEDKEPGLYRVAVARAGEWQAEQRWVLITDLGMVAKRGADGALSAWVFSFQDLAPRPGVEVRLLSDQNQTLARGTTDAAGYLRFDDAKVREGQPYLLLAETGGGEAGGDRSFLYFNGSAIDTTGLDVRGASPRSEGYEAFLYGERDLYRPGEVVEGVAVVRDRRLRPAPAMPVVLRNRDASGQVRETQRLEVKGSGAGGGGQGMVPFEVEVPGYARTGFHTLELAAGDRTIGQYRFQVEEFIPDRIRVEIEAPTASPGPGEELSYGVDSAYLFGPPASGLALETRVRLEAAPFLPEGFEGYRFDNAERAFEGLEILAREGELDDAGEGSFRVRVPEGLAPPSSLAAVVTARVRERGGRGVTAVERIPVDPYPYYLGLKKAGEGYAEPGQAVSFEWVAVKPGAGAGEERTGNSAKTAAGSLRAELYRDRWNTVLRHTPEGGVRYESVRDPRLIATQALEGGRQDGSFTFTPDTYGAYRAVITDLATGASAQVSFYAAGWGYSPWAIESPGRVELDLDKEEYAPGETAVVQVRAPFPGKLLLTVEREGVIERRVETLSGNTASLRFTVEESWRPNVYVTAILVRPAAELAPGTPGRAFGAVPLSVDRSAKRLPLTVEAPEEMRPENPLTVRVKTAPGAAVTVAAVDEGILRLVEQETPDPFAFFYRKLALGVTSYDTFALLLPEVGAATPGGGDGAGREQYVSAASMLRVEPAAFWSGVLTAGPDGTAEARFPVPPFQGRLRVMAVAVDGDRFASEEDEVLVRDRLVVLPTLPRFLQLGDRLSVPVTVRNDTGSAEPVGLTVTWTEPGRAPRSETARLEVADGGDGTAYVPIELGFQPGVVDFTVSGEMQGTGERTRARAKVPLRPVLPPERRLASGVLAAPTLELPAAVDGLLPGTGTRTLTVGPAPLVRFGGRLSELLAYPYGCLEQTVSRTFPMLYLADLARALDPEVFEEGSPEVRVEEGLRRVAALQLPSGGFGMWPDASTSDPWVSLYAAHLLVEAGEAGHGGAYQAREEALAYTARSVAAKASYGQDELARTAYALYVLARAGRADLGSMDFLRERHEAALDPASKALLAAAYAALGDPEAAEELAARVGEVDRVASRTAGSRTAAPRGAPRNGADPGGYASPLRDRALLLMALLDAAPADPRIPALVDRLAREAEAARDWTTQEAGFVFVALGRLYRRQLGDGEGGGSSAPISGKVFVGDRLLGGFGPASGSGGGGRGVGQPAGAGALGAAVFRDIAGSEPLRIEVEGGEAGWRPGSVFYSLVTRGVPTDEAFRPESSGLEIERAFLDRDGNEARLASVRQGDLLVVRLRVRSTEGPVPNVVVANLLPSGLEVENPRLRSTETLPWVNDASLDPAALDLRDDRVLAFTDLPAGSWRTLYTLVRAVVPGTFRLPPVSAEAMYSPGLRAVSEEGTITIAVRP